MSERETNGVTPLKLSEDIINICKSNDISDLFYMPRQPKDDCEAGDCFKNVKKYVDNYGGSLIMGWGITIRRNLYVECEAHAVWQAPDGQIIDITPPSYDNGTQTLYSHQIDMPVKKTPSRYLPITKSELVKEYIELRNQFEQIRCNAGETIQIPKFLMHRIIIIEDVFMLKVGRNEKCPCQSGLKYKQCCGR